MILTQAEIEQAIIDLQRIQEDNPDALIWITKKEEGEVITEGFTVKQLQELKKN